MKAKEIDIKQFNTIEDLYLFIDANVFNIELNYDLTNLWVNYREYVSSEDEKEKAQWEIDCLTFDIKGKMLFSQIYSEYRGPNDISKYPDLTKFKNSAIDYLKNRAALVNNSILKARYNHLLWKCPTGIKHNKYALTAIESYIKAISKYCDLFHSDRQSETTVQIGKLHENLVAISDEVKSDNTNLKDLTNFLLFKTEGIEFYTRHGILDDMLKYPKIFKAQDFENTLTLFDLEIAKQEPNDYMLVHRYLPTAVKIAAKLQSDVKKWHYEIGLSYLRCALKETKEERFWLKLDLYTKAIEFFSLAKNDEKRKETEKLYAELKPKVTLPLHTLEYDEKMQKERLENHETIKELAKSILKNTPNKVYEAIAQGLFFPKSADVLKTAKKSTTFLDFTSTTIYFDKNKNIGKQQKSSEELRKVYDTYSYYAKNMLLPYLHFIIIPGIQTGHLTFENFITYIVKQTWIGKPHQKYDLSGEGKPINWIGILSPSIIEFFVQIQAWCNSKYYRPSFVLCVDSLSLKMEGLLRDFCERIGIPVSVNRPKGMQEVYIHNLLEEEELKKYCNDDDLLFLNYLFSNEGLNMRNNVAHCFYEHNEYCSDQMLLLIAALLRIGKHDYKSQTTS